MAETDETGTELVTDFTLVPRETDVQRGQVRQTFIIVPPTGCAGLAIDEIAAIQAVEGARLAAGKRTAIRVKISTNGSGSARNVRLKIVRDGQEFSKFYPLVSENLWGGIRFRQSTTSINIPPYPPELDVYFFPPDHFWPQALGTYEIAVIAEADGDPGPCTIQAGLRQETVNTRWGDDEELWLAFYPIEEQQDYNAGNWLSFVERTFPVAELNVKHKYNEQLVTLPPRDEVACARFFLGLSVEQWKQCRKAQYANMTFDRTLATT